MGKRGNTVKHEGGKRFSRESLISSCAIGSFLSWLSLSFRAAGAPEFTFPVFFLSYPRIDEAWLAAMSALVASSIVIAIVLAAKPACRSRRWLACSVGAILMTGGGAFVLFSPQSFDALVVGGAAAGVGIAAFLACWLPCAAEVSRETLVRNFVGGLAVACAIDVTLLVTVTTVSLAILAILPVATAALVLYGMHLADANAGKRVDRALEARMQQADGGVLLGGTMRVATLLFAFTGFAFFMGIVGFNTDPLAPEELLAHQAALMAGGSALAALVLASARRWERLDLVPIATLLLIATAMLLLPLSGTMAVSSGAVVLAQASLMCSYALLVLALRDDSLRRAAGSPARRPALAVAIIGTCQLFGILGGGAVRSVFGLSLTALALTAMLVLYLAFFAILVMTRGRKRVEHVIIGPYADEAEIARIRCGILVERFPSLSARETEVLELLLQNYSNARIAKELVVSDNTVKTHVRHVYEKMGVKSRQQLFELAGSVRLESESETG